MNYPRSTIHVEDLVQRFGARNCVWVRTPWNNSWAVALSGCTKAAMDYPRKRVQFIELAGHTHLDTDNFIAAKVIERMEHAKS